MAAPVVVPGKVTPVSGAELGELQHGGSDLIVVDVHAPWCTPCGPLSLFAEKFPEVTFVSLSSTELGDDDIRATSEPTLLLFIGQKRFDTLNGIDGARLSASIRKFQSMRAMLATTGSLEGGSTERGPRRVSTAADFSGMLSRKTSERRT